MCFIVLFVYCIEAHDELALIIVTGLMIIGFVIVIHVVCAGAIGLSFRARGGVIRGFFSSFIRLHVHANLLRPPSTTISPPIY